MSPKNLPALAILLLAACSAAPPKLEARDGWTRETGGATSAAIYLTVANKGRGSDRLVAVTSERGKAGLHRSETIGGVARMHSVPASEGLDIPAGGELRLSPGGAHVMLTGLDAPLRQGDRFAMTLRFKRTAPRKLTIEVRMAGIAHGAH